MSCGSAGLCFYGVTAFHDHVCFKVSHLFPSWESFVKKYFLVICLVEIFIE